MYSVMMVDDEAGVRNGLKAKIDWEASGFRIEWEASNGVEALELLKNGASPDVILTDIRMPKLDGVGLAKTCRELYPGLRIVILSGYSDFEYTKAAIQLGVKDYLLKPVARGELTALLTSIASELKIQAESLSIRKQEELQKTRMLLMMQEQLIWQLVKSEWFSLVTMKERMLQLQLAELADEHLAAQFVVVEMRVPNGRLEEGSGRKDLLYLAFQLLCRESAEKREYVYPLYDIHHPAMMFFLVLVDGYSTPDGGPSLVRELQRDIRRYMKVDSVCGIGEPVQGLRHLKDAYASCMLSWSQSTVHSESRDEGNRLVELIQVFTPEVEKKIIHAIENMDMKAFQKQLETVFTPDSDTPMYGFTLLTLRMILLFTSIANKFELQDASLQKYLWNCQMAVRDYHSREQVLEQLCEMGRLVMEEVRRARFSSGQQLIIAIRKYVDDNFSYEITLSSLANLFHLNETYLSGLFKQSTGVTFSDYVTRLRLEKAAELLKENELKLTDIATLVGYSSSSYFSTVFKKGYGMSPKDYRELQSYRKGQAD